MPDYDLPVQGYDYQPTSNQAFGLPVAMPTNADAIAIRPVQEARPEPIVEVAQRPEPVIHESGKQLIAIDHNPWLDTEFSKGTKIGNRLFGTGGEERYQTWPEKMIRSGFTAPHDALAGEIQPYEVDPETGAVHTSREMIERVMDMAGLAGTGGLGGVTDATLGATPFLRPALKYKEKLYKGKEGQQHSDVIPESLYPDFQKKAMSGEDINDYNFGFVNDKGHFLDREAALKYGIDTGLIDPQAGKFGALTSTLMSDSSKPGTAIESLAKTKRLEKLKSDGYDTEEPVFHETDKDFKTFKPTHGSQVWFTTDKTTLGDNGASGKGKVVTAYLKHKKLAARDDYEKYGTDELISKGYDGARLEKDIVMFKPENIKIHKIDKHEVQSVDHDPFKSKKG